jgi:hypothetical protein
VSGADPSAVLWLPARVGLPLRGRYFVFQCYLDDSGTSGLPIVTMAGFVAAMQHWETLEPTLDSILNRDEISVLHAKEFHDIKPPFQGWTKDKKQGLADELFTASHGLLYGLSVSVRKQEFEKAKKEQGKWNTMSAIGVCFSTIMTKIVTDPNIAQQFKAKEFRFSSRPAIEITPR